MKRRLLVGVLDALVMVVLNKNTAAYTLETSRFGEMLGSSAGIIGVDVIRGGRFDLSAPIALEPRAALVLKVER